MNVIRYLILILIVPIFVWADFMPSMSLSLGPSFQSTGAGFQLAAEGGFYYLIDNYTLYQPLIVGYHLNKNKDSSIKNIGSVGTAIGRSLSGHGPDMFFLGIGGAFLIGQGESGRAIGGQIFSRISLIELIYLQGTLQRYDAINEFQISVGVNIGLCTTIFN